MTPAERSAYKQALLSIKGTMQGLGCLHETHFQQNAMNVHGGEFFFPWHRWFQYLFEAQLKKAPTTHAKYLNVPYWDWRTDGFRSKLTWTKSDFLGDFSTLWGLGRTLDSEVIKDTSIFRSIQTAFTMPGGNALDFGFFSGTIERFHDGVHGAVGGIMGGGQSPYDPVFFLHHGFIDKLWAEWEDRRPSKETVLSAFFNPVIPHHDHDTTLRCLIGNETIDIPFKTPHFLNAEVVDARSQDFNADGTTDNEAWYAYNGLLLLDGLGGNFETRSDSSVYAYVAWDTLTKTTSGKIYVGDVKRGLPIRNGTSITEAVEADNKGGFVVKSTSKVRIQTAQSITFHPGTAVEYGAVLQTALSSVPYGFSSNASFRTEEMAENVGTHAPAAAWLVHPNPATQGVVSFGRTASQFALMNQAGVVLLSGQMADQIEVTAIPKGLYLLKLEDQVQKLIIQ